MVAVETKKTLFSHIVIDSNSSPERNFARHEDNDDVIFYIKLPRWFQITRLLGIKQVGISLPQR